MFVNLSELRIENNAVVLKILFNGCKKPINQSDLRTIMWNKKMLFKVQQSGSVKSKSLG